MKLGNQDSMSGEMSSSFGYETDHSESKSKSTGQSSTKESSVEDHHLARRETDAVFKLRLLVILVLIAAAVAISVVVYMITSNAEWDSFHSQYDGVSNKVVDAFENIIKNKLGALASLAVAAIANGEESSRSWPYVTLSAFPQRSATVRSISGAFFVCILGHVTDDQRVEWEDFMAEEGTDSAKKDLQYQEAIGMDVYLGRFGGSTEAIGDDRSTWKIYNNFPDGSTAYEEGPGPYLPVLQASPLTKEFIINQNFARNPWHGKEVNLSMNTSSMVIGDLITSLPGDTSSDSLPTVVYASMISASTGQPYYHEGDPVSGITVPIFDSFGDDRRAVAAMMALVRWGSYFENILPENVMGLTAVLENSCTGAFTYQINGKDVEYVGPGDLHDQRFTEMGRKAAFEGITTIEDGTRNGLNVNENFCPLQVQIYPSQVFYDTYITNIPILITFSVGMVFIFAVCMFLVYDRLVERRQKIVLTRAEYTTAIVSSLFPKNIAQQMLQDQAENIEHRNFLSGNKRLQSFLSGRDSDVGMQPIADLFPEATVLFADIAGFTAWSSSREPAQVFVLLQNIYQAFDEIAKKRKVFKVETIGDSYVAVTGVPDPQKDHAMIMARYARDCIIKMNQVVGELEVTLGPDTGDLAMRFGIHSGQVTAGVLRGERARFQLFGDTVNTAARMESTGEPNKIQISETTAQILVGAGKGHWVKARADAVKAKGKGVLNTYWLTPNTKRTAASICGESDSGISDSNDASTKHDRRIIGNHARTTTKKADRLVDWVCEIIMEHMRKVTALRKNTKGECFPRELIYKLDENKTYVDEIREVVILPEFDPKSASPTALDASSIEIDATSQQELRRYISIIAATYHNNPFHNFEHACHVTMSVNKLLKRIVTPDLEISQVQGKDGIASQIYDYTYGINSDPLAHLAIIFSAVIHDADHRGVSNVQLMKEEPSIAKLYRSQSIAEQNSLALAWELLMSDQFENLRCSIFSSREDVIRFYQVLVNVVLATDIFDKDLNQLRKARWQKAFHDDTIEKDHLNDIRATIVIEHIIQASDVSHTMQHWHVYRKWNHRLFMEMHKAYSEGRMGADPADFWYKGELGFFDNYIIPLAKKLKECNVFGVSSDEYLNYAQANRAEWAARGEEIVMEMVEELASTK